MNGVWRGDEERRKWRVASGVLFDALVDLLGRHQKGEGMVNGVRRVGGGE